MTMSRSEHWARAQELISEVDRSVQVDRYRPVMTEVDRERVTLALVHATLAAAPPDVAEEDPLPLKLDAALEELADQDSVESTTYAASFIRSRTLGGETL